MPITHSHVEGVLLNPDSEYRVVAEIDGRVVGIGALVLKNAELRACYVAPSASRQGVGSLIVQKLESIAHEHALKTLDLDATVTAEPFYAAHGYSVRERGERVLRGQRMACVKMHKVLALQNS